MRCTLPSPCLDVLQFHCLKYLVINSEPNETGQAVSLWCGSIRLIALLNKHGEARGVLPGLVFVYQMNTCGFFPSSDFSVNSSAAAASCSLPAVLSNHQDILHDNCMDISNFITIPQRKHELASGGSCSWSQDPAQGAGGLSLETVAGSWVRREPAL